MSEEKIKSLANKMQAIRGLKRAPSQYQIFLFILSTGRTITVRELSSELGTTPKATERAVAKLLSKGLIQRATFRAQSYACDSKDIMLSMLLTINDLQNRLDKKGI